MWVSEVKTKKVDMLDLFTIANLLRLWMRVLIGRENLAMQILENGFYKDEELVMHHYEDNE